MLQSSDENDLCPQRACTDLPAISLVAQKTVRSLMPRRARAVRL